MSHTFTAVQWNIGGGKVRTPTSDPLTTASYVVDNLEHIIDVLRQEKPDVITLQEVHASQTTNQVTAIAQALGYAYYVSDFYSESHIEHGYQLGQGIISRYPLSDHTSLLLTNPQYEATWKDVGTVSTHDKGITSCATEIDGELLTIKTLHLIPFDPFKVDPMSETAQVLFREVASKLSDKTLRLLIQGDLNLGRRNPSIDQVMPALGDLGIEEVVLELPTIPNGERPDRIMYKGLQVHTATVLTTVLTDHYPIVTTFEL